MLNTEINGGLDLGQRLRRICILKLQHVIQSPYLPGDQSYSLPRFGLLVYFTFPDSAMVLVPLSLNSSLESGIMIPKQ